MKMNQPIGDVSFGPFLIRISLGSYFVLAGLLKLDNLDAFLQIVSSFSLLPKQLAIIVGGILPYLEVASGILLVLGFWTTLAGFMSSILLISFIYMFGIYPKGSTELFNKDIILLCASISLLYTGAGMLSVDNFRKQ